jgi:type 1 glutamine amidotransferase
VLVLNDQMNWPEATRAQARQAVEAGRGFVLLHNSLGDNQDWPWWYEDVTGGLLVLDNQNGKKSTAVSSAAKLDIRPAAKHPILRNVAPFTLGNEEVYKNMWQSPKITPLLLTSNSGSDSTIAWIGVHPAARVVCIQPGASRETHRNPAYRMLVRNSILWAARRI